MGIELGKIAGIVGTGAVGGIVALVGMALISPIATKMASAEAQAQSPRKIDVVRPKPYSNISGEMRTLRVDRSSDLSFHLIAQINHKPVQMLVDTGANITVLTKKDAERLGIPNVRKGHIAVTGINQNVSKYRMAGRWPITIGPIGLDNVNLAVDDDNQLANSILGQDAYCNIDRITIADNAIEFAHQGPVAPGCSGVMG